MWRDPERSHTACMNQSLDNNSVAWQCDDVQIIATCPPRKEWRQLSLLCLSVWKQIRYILAVTFKTRDIWRFTSEKKKKQKKNTFAGTVGITSFWTVDVTAFLIFQWEFSQMLLKQLTSNLPQKLSDGHNTKKKVLRCFSMSMPFCRQCSQNKYFNYMY